MCTLCAATRPDDLGAQWETHVSGSQVSQSAPAQSASRSQLETIADYLRVGFWQDVGEAPRKFDVSAGGTLTYFFKGMSADEKFVAKAALQAWTDVTGIKFKAAASAAAADIEFFNTDEGAFSFSDITGNTITKSYVNVDKNWDSDPISLNSYWFQTYVHEIGHALGLGHAGNYNFDGTTPVFEEQAKFAKDSWQASVMSYFAQSDNPNINADYAFLATVMPADIMAIQDMYGTNVNTRSGNTVYGHNSNVTGYLRQLFDAAFDNQNVSNRTYLDHPLAFTVFDSGGNDTLNFASLRSKQTINLNDGATSSIGGIRGGMLIAHGTMIENAIGGKGADRITGNELANRLSGIAGNDTLIGGAGRDVLNGAAGADIMNGGSGFDTAVFGGKAAIRVNLANSTAQNTGQGSDRLTGIENVTSGGGNDRLSGNSAGNLLSGGGGADKLDGLKGADTLNGGNGNDVLTGSAGNDLMNGGAGKNRLAGGDGNDKLNGGSVRDILNGGGGNDRLTDAGGNDQLVGGKGNDRLTAGAGADRLSGGDGADTLNGGTGNDTLSGGTAADQVNGEDGNDRLNGSAGNDGLNGATGNDTLNGEAGLDTLNGGTGTDTLNGGTGSDLLDGGDDADRLIGGDGADTMTGGNGNDTMTGGAGADRFDFGAGLDQITDFADNEDTLHLNSSLWGGALSVQQVLDTLAFEEGGNVVFRFSAGNELLLTGIALKADLLDDIVLI